MDPFIGEIRAFAGNYAPTGWFLCQGQTLPINAYQALFAVIGTFYGGNGTSNFQLPNLQGRAILGAGMSQSGQAYNPGETGGSAAVTLTINNLPSHSHAASSPAHTHGFTVPPHTHPFSPLCDNSNGGDTNPAGEFPGAGGAYSIGHADSMGAQTTGQSTATPGTTAGAAVGVSIQNTGNGLPVETISPYAVVNYIIAYNGVFPSRS